MHSTTGIARQLKQLMQEHMHIHFAVYVDEKCRYRNHRNIVPDESASAIMPNVIIALDDELREKVNVINGRKTFNLSPGISGIRRA